MRRRDFVLTSGSAILTGLATSHLHKPAVGINFEISTPDKDPSEVRSILVDFETLGITPQYLNENKNMKVQVKIEVSNQTKTSDELQTSVKNGTTKQLGNDIDPIVIDGINTDNSIRGTVTVLIDHPNIKDKYAKTFTFDSGNIPDSALTQNLVAWYRFENGDARDYASNSEFPNTTFGNATSYSGTISNATHLTNNGVEDFANGTQTGAFKFDGQSNYIYNDSFPAYGDEARTIMAWCWIANTDSFMNILSLGSGNNSNERWSILLENGTLNVGLIGQQNDYKFFDAGLSTEQWFHIAFTYDGSGTIKMYRDATLFNTSATTSFNTVGGIAVGTIASNDEREFFDGKIDDVRFYNHVLTEPEITDIYNQTKP
jgi:hypothetical protein